MELVTNNNIESIYKSQNVSFNYLKTTRENQLELSIDYNYLSFKTESNEEKNIFWKFSNAYRPIHGWLSTFVCLFGITSNSLNIIILTRSNMITSSTNLILIGLATSDLFTMLSSLIFSFYFYILHANKSVKVALPERDTFGWTHFSNLHIMATVTFHSISIWLTVYLALFRYIYLASTYSVYRVGLSSSTDRGKHNMNYTIILNRLMLKFRSYNFTLWCIIYICAFCIIFCFPAYIYPTVKEILYHSNNNLSSFYNSSNLNATENMNCIKIAYYITSSELDLKTNGLVFNILFYTQAILGKFIPCLLLISFSLLLIHQLVIINRKNKQLSINISILNMSNRNNGQKNSIERSNLLDKHKKNNTTFCSYKLSRTKMKTKLNNRFITKCNRQKENLRTTSMLTIVCILFLISEFPQCLLILIIMINGKSFHENVYIPLGDLIDIIALVNSSINFILYCIMSRLFRKTFYNFISNIFRSFCSCFKFQI